MATTCTTAARTRAVVGALLLAIMMAACDNVPYVAKDSEALKVIDERQTGSNLARRDSIGTGARQVDKDALESSLRGTNANRDNGR